MATIQNSKKARKAAAATLAATKENPNVTEGLSAVEKLFKVIQSEKQDPANATTSIGIRSRQSTTKVNYASRHFTPGKKLQAKPERTTISIKKPSVFKMWSQLCPCSSTEEYTRVVEAPRDHFNCIKCGALAIQKTSSSQATAAEGTKTIYGLKPEQYRQKCEITQQKTIAQLRKTSQNQSEALRHLVPTDGNFDDRILQIRATMMQLICEVAECLHQSTLTKHLAVEYMDRYLLIRNNNVGLQGLEHTDGEFFNSIFEGNSLDAVVISCLLLASKFDEIDDNIPMIDEFCKAHTLVKDSLDSGFLQDRSQNEQIQMGQGRTYPGFKAVERCELYLLYTLSWDLNTVTPLHFVQQHLFHGVVFTIDQAQSETAIDNALLLKVHRHVDFFANEVLKQKFMLTKEFSDQIIAASVIYAARFASKVIQEPWLEDVFSHVFKIQSRSEISACFDQLYSAYESSNSATKQNQQLQRSSHSEARKPHKIEIKLSLVESVNSELKENQTDRDGDSSPAFRNTTGDSQVNEQSEKLSESQCGFDGAGRCSTKSNEDNNGSNDFSQVVAHSAKHSISLDASTEEAATKTQPKKPCAKHSESKKGPALKSTKKSSNVSHHKKQSHQGGLITTITATKSKSKTRPGQQPQSVTHSRQTSITSFEQQQPSYTPLHVLNRPGLQLSKAVDCFGQTDGVSLSPVKEHYESQKKEDTGPIKVFKSRQARHTLQEPPCRDRSSSSTSLFRLQPTSMAINSNIKRQSFGRESVSTKNGMLIGLPSHSSESQQKRFGNNARSSRQSAVTPRVHNFLLLNRQQSEAQPQQRDVSEAIETEQENESSRGPLNRLLQKQKQAVAREDPDNRRFQASKSIVFGRRKTEDLSVPRSELPESGGAQELKPQETERQTLKGSNVRSQAKSALSQVKVYLQGDGGQSTSTRNNREHQNFIRKNINYVTQLDQNVKERRSLQTCYSFIDLEPKIKLSQMSRNGRQDQTENVNGCDARFSLKTFQVKPSIAGGKRQTPLGHSSMYQSTSVGPGDTLQRASSKSVMEGRTPKLALQQSDLEPSISIYADSSNITPKQVSSYRASKLFSKKPMATTNSSINVAMTDDLILSPAIVETEQVTTLPNKPTALHKFKACAQLRQSSKGTSSSLLQQQQTRDTQLTLTSIIDETVTAAAVYGAREMSVTPHEGSGSANFGTLTASKQRPSNNHLRPTKSSMLRAKSSLGLSQPSQYVEADPTNMTTLGKSNGIIAKSTLMQEILVQMPAMSTNQQWLVAPLSKSSSYIVSPKFGPPKNHKSRAAITKINTIKQLEVLPPSVTCVDKDASKQQPTTPVEPSSKKVKPSMAEDHHRPRATLKPNHHQPTTAISRNKVAGTVSKRQQSGQRTFASRLSLKPQQQPSLQKPTQKQARERSPQQQPSTSSKTTENSKIQVKSQAFRGSFQLR